MKKLMKSLVAFVLLAFCIFPAAIAFAAEPEETIGMFAKIINFIDGAPAWINALTAVLVALSGLAALTPTRSDNAIFDAGLRILNFLSMNFFKAKNADEVEFEDRAGK